MKQIVLEPNFSINQDIGLQPETMSVEQRLASGFILLDKPCLLYTSDAADE